MQDKWQEIPENIYNVHYLHMEVCNKSAIILPRTLAIQSHTLLLAEGKPTYFAKDTILENLAGLKLTGYFPSNVIQRVKYLSQNGIYNWWKNYLDFAFVLNTCTLSKRFEYMRNGQVTQASKGGVKVALIIFLLMPGIGILASFLIFVIFEIKVLTI